MEKTSGTTCQSSRSALRALPYRQTTEPEVLQVNIKRQCRVEPLKSHTIITIKLSRVESLQ